MKTSWHVLPSTAGALIIIQMYICKLLVLCDMINLLTPFNWLEYNILSSDNFLLSCDMLNDKQSRAVKKGTAKQSRINAAEYDW